MYMVVVVKIYLLQSWGLIAIQRADTATTSKGFSSYSIYYLPEELELLFRCEIIRYFTLKRLILYFDGDAADDGLALQEEGNYFRDINHFAFKLIYVSSSSLSSHYSHNNLHFEKRNGGNIFLIHTAKVTIATSLEM